MRNSLQQFGKLNYQESTSHQRTHERAKDRYVSQITHIQWTVRWSQLIAFADLDICGRRCSWNPITDSFNKVKALQCAPNGTLLNVLWLSDAFMSINFQMVDHILIHGVIIRRGTSSSLHFNLAPSDVFVFLVECLPGFSREPDSHSSLCEQ